MTNLLQYNVLRCHRRLDTLYPKVSATRQVSLDPPNSKTRLSQRRITYHSVTDLCRGTSASANENPSCIVISNALPSPLSQTVTSTPPLPSDPPRPTLTSYPHRQVSNPLRSHSILPCHFFVLILSPWPTFLALTSDVFHDSHIRDTLGNQHSRQASLALCQSAANPLFNVGATPRHIPLPAPIADRPCIVEPDQEARLAVAASSNHYTY
ncbi:hypothetical protein V8E53_011170 [Lactarius tabidus]